MMNKYFNPYGLLSYLFCSAFAVLQEWSLPAYCWSTWLAGLIYCWFCTTTAAIQIMFTTAASKDTYHKRFPALQTISPMMLIFGVVLVSGLTAVIAIKIYGYIFGFYGVFLSVFAEMEPLHLFGKSGFINSDFYTPLMYLLEHYWPMVLGVLIANWKGLYQPNPWKRILIPRKKELLRIHLMILVLPFFSLAAWAMFDDEYQSITILLIMGIFYLLPTQID